MKLAVQVLLRAVVSVVLGPGTAVLGLPTTSTYAELIESHLVL